MKTSHPVAIAITWMLCGALALMAAPAAWAETCYRDDSGRIVKRRRPGSVEVPCPAPTPAGTAGATEAADTGRLPSAFTGGVVVERGPRPAASPVPRPDVRDYVESTPVPDRWRIVDSLGYRQDLFDPYNRNILKGDKPIHDDWFFSMNLLSDTVFESRDVVEAAPKGSAEAFERPRQDFYSQTLSAEFVYYKGDTVFKPPEYEFRFTPVYNYNRVAGAASDGHLGIQAAFFDKHLRTVSEHYDFDGLRIGIQPFSSDFRGFLFQDNQPGVRLFGIRDNNIYQYNLAYFRRLAKDPGNGLNDLARTPRHDDILAFNIYRQDSPRPGFTSQLTLVYDHDRESAAPFINGEGASIRPALLGTGKPRDYDVAYLGYNGDGHVGPWNLTASAYYAGGHESAATFASGSDTVSAWFGAAELSRDFDWIRPRLSLLFASGDHNPLDHRATGFDAIAENPQFAGADASYWIRQSVPLLGGTDVSLSGRNGLLNNLRAGPNGQSNFTNPGTVLLGLGGDFDVLPTLRVALNLNDLSFADTAVLSLARGGLPVARHIGEDASIALVYRPLMSQNVVLRSSYSRLFAGAGYRALYPGSSPGYFLLNVIVAY